MAIYRRCKTKFDEFVSSGRALHNYATILELLLRMRQACDHPYLCLSRSDVGSFESRDFDVRKVINSICSQLTFNIMCSELRAIL